MISSNGRCPSTARPRNATRNRSVNAGRSSFDWRPYPSSSNVCISRLDMGYLRHFVTGKTHTGVSQLALLGPLPLVAEQAPDLVPHAAELRQRAYVLGFAAQALRDVDDLFDPA